MIHKDPIVWLDGARPPKVLLPWRETHTLPTDSCFARLMLRRCLPIEQKSTLNVGFDLDLKYKTPSYKAYALFMMIKILYNRTALIGQQCRKTTVLSFHRCPINTGVEK